MLLLPTLGAFHPRWFGVGPADKVGKEEATVLVFVDLRVNPKDMSLDELWTYGIRKRSLRSRP